MATLHVRARVFVKDIATTHDGWEMQIVRFEPGAPFPLHMHDRPEFVFILEGELIQDGRRLGPGWASVASAGSIDADVHSETPGASSCSWTARDSHGTPPPRR